MFDSGDYMLDVRMMDSPVWSMHAKTQSQTDNPTLSKSAGGLGSLLIMYNLWPADPVTISLHVDHTASVPAYQSKEIIACKLVMPINVRSTNPCSG